MVDRIVLPPLLAAAILFSAGCALLSQPYTEVRHFDLGAQEPSFERLSGIVVRGNAAYRLSFVYRRGTNEILRDEYNRWSVSPEKLVESSLKKMFSLPARADGRHGVEISLDVFEFNLDRNTAVLKAACTVKGKSGDVGQFAFASETGFGEDTPGALATAMRANMDKMAEEINRKIASNKED